jgi:preprotein translocase subunit SecB
MSDQQAGNGAPPPAPLVLNIQYVKDLSFEVPDAPAIFATLRQQPAVDIALDVQARPIQQGQNIYEVSLSVRAEAKHEGKPVFIAELMYCGIFTLNGIPEAQVEPVLLVECPRLIFPFARAILGDVTREGGFPPVMLQPIDFFALWQSRRAQGQPAVATA